MVLSRVARVGLNKEGTRFKVDAPFDMVERCRSIPNRRWEKRHSAWVGPMIRANARYLLEDQTWWEGSPETVVALESVARGPGVERKGLPASYLFKMKPFAHQLRALNRLWGLREMAFFMEMGTGKTKTWVDMCASLMAEGHVERVVVVSPNSVIPTWLKQVPEHSPIDFDILHLELSRAGDWMKRLSETRANMVIAAVESMSSPLNRAGRALEAYLARGKAAIVVDESSTIKNWDATRSQRLVNLAALADYRAIMTGTEISRSIEDLYMQFQFLNPGIIGIGDYYSFRNRYVVMGGYEHREVVGYKNLDELMEIVRPYVFSITKAEALPDLPPKVYESRYVDLTDEQMKLHAAIMRGQVIPGMEIDIANCLVAYLRAQQVVGGFFEKDGRAVSMFADPGKNPKIRELLQVIAEGHGPTIIWTRFLPELEQITFLLGQRFGADQVVNLRGGMSGEERKGAEQRFQSLESRFLVGTQSSGGMGIDLHRATTAIYYSNTFAMVDRVQSEDRPHRPGQTRSLAIIDIIARGSVDLDIFESINKKMDMAAWVKERMAKA